VSKKGDGTHSAYEEWARFSRYIVDD